VNLFKILITIITIISLSPLSIKSQNIDGVVIDDKGESLAGISVSLRNRDFSPLKFSMTDEGGNFSFKRFDETAVYLIASGVGFSPDTLTIKELEFPVIIKLSEHIFKLHEVLVRSDRGYQRGDTINYFVSAYSGIGDRTVSDVLKKMPGIEVNKDGTILFNGRRISSLYVEGLDLMSEQYAQISENLNATDVAKVQILQSHQPIKLLQKTSFTDDVALNLVLKDSAKNVWQHSLGGGTGSSLTTNPQIMWDGEFSTMMFSKQLQSVSLIKGNNFGINIAREIEALSWFEDKSLLNFPVKLQSIGLANIDEEIWHNGKSGIFATNWLCKIGTGNLRVQVSGNLDRSISEQFNTLTYNKINGNPTVIDNSQIELWQRIGTGKVDYELNSDKIYLKNSFGINCSFPYSKGDSEVNGIQEKDLTKIRQFTLRDVFSIMKRQREKIWTLDGSIFYSKSPSQLRLMNGLIQDLDYSTLSWQLSGSYKRSISRIILNCPIGLGGECNSISNIVGETSNFCRYSDLTVSLSPQFSYIYNDKLKGELDFNMFFSRRNIKENISCGQSNFYINPYLRISYNPINKIRVGINGGFKIKPNSFFDVINFPIYENKMRANVGVSKFETSKSISFGGYLNYSNMVTGWSAAINGTFSYSWNLSLSQGVLTDGVYYSLKSDNPTNAINSFVFGSLTKSLNIWNSSINLFGRLNNIKTKIIVSNQECPQQITNGNITLSYNANPLSWFTFKCECQASWTNQKIEKSSLVSPSTSNISYTEILKLSTNWNKITFTLDTRGFQNAQKGIKSIYMINTQISWSHKQWLFDFIVHNFLNQEKYYRSIITETSTSVMQTSLRSREFLLKCTYSF